MDDNIRVELSKVKFADLSHYDEATNTYYIKKCVEVNLQEGHYYLIHLKSGVENTYITTNWNVNKPRPLNIVYFKANINKILGKMIQITGEGYEKINDTDTLNDTGVNWTGWINKEDVETATELF